MNVRSNGYRYAYLALAVLFVDRVTKYFALVYQPAQSGSGKLLSFELAFNRGVTWGMFHNAQGVFAYAAPLVSVIVTSFLIRYAAQRYQQGFPIYAEILVITGSCSNLFDRFVYGGVIDFILLSYKSWSWPIFNVADMAIVLGVGIIVLNLFRQELSS